MKCSLQFTIIAVAVMFFAAACGQQDDHSTRDFRLAQAVRDQFATDQETKGATSRVRVEAKDGIVTLSGTTDTVADKTLAETIARRTVGVANVVNEIAVIGTAATSGQSFDERSVRELARANGESIGQSSDDARIYSEVRRKIVAYEATPKKSIFVDVEGGDVTLRGMVFTTVARDEAVAAARNTEGVNAVRDQLMINTPAP